jgi:hypothetical protein
VLCRDGAQVLEVACRHPAGRGQPGEQTAGHALVLVRRGCFARSADGEETLLDPTVAYCMSPGQEQRYDHPHGHGDDCTALFFERDLIASIWGGDPGLPAGPCRFRLQSILSTGFYWQRPAAARIRMICSNERLLSSPALSNRLIALVSRLAARPLRAPEPLSPTPRARRWPPSRIAPSRTSHVHSRSLRIISVVSFAPPPVTPSLATV